VEKTQATERPGRGRDWTQQGGDLGVACPRQEKVLQRRKRGPGKTPRFSVYPETWGSNHPFGYFQLTQVGGGVVSRETQYGSLIPKQGKTKVQPTQKNRVLRPGKALERKKGKKPHSKIP